MHTVLGLLELEMYDDAVEFVGEVVGDHRVTAEQVTEKIHDPLLAALLVGKATVAAERGVALWVADGTLLPDRLVDPRGLVTVVGNLVDNALDAVAGTPHARVEVELHAEGRTAVLRVRDTGPGIPAERRELVFTDGWSTKKPPAHGKRGLGLSLVRRLAERQGGSAKAAEADGGGAEFTVVLPEALTEAGLGPTDSLEPAEGLVPTEGPVPAEGLMPGPEGEPGREPGRGPAPELVRQSETLSQNTTGATAAEEESR
jgi:two-component system CitB family sensor kinase